MHGHMNNPSDRRSIGFISLPKTLRIRAAVDDLKRHSLASLRGDIAQLLWVAGTRDYNTGHYYHDGLAACFTQEIASRALAQCHEECFRRLVRVPIENLVKMLEEYISCHRPGDEFVFTWLKLEPYRVLAPLGCDPVSAQLFHSNLKIALSILELRTKNHSRS